MACCLTAPSHYLNQCWLIISEIPWHSSQVIIIKSINKTILKIAVLKWHPGLPGANELIKYVVHLPNLFGGKSANICLVAWFPYWFNFLKCGNDAFTNEKKREQLQHWLILLFSCQWNLSETRLVKHYNGKTVCLAIIMFDQSCLWSFSMTVVSPMC